MAKNKKNKNVLKIPPHPIKAYYKGHSNGVADGFLAFAYLSLIAMKNTNTEQQVLTNEEFKTFFIETEKELNRIFTEEYKNDPQDVVNVAMYHTNELRKEMGLETV